MTSLISMSAIEKTVSEMHSSEAVGYLLGVIELMHPVLRDHTHSVDDLGINLTGQQRKLMIILYEARSFLTKEQIIDALYAHRANADSVPGSKIIDVLVCKIRAKLPDHIQIRTIHGQGYELVIEEAA